MMLDRKTFDELFNRRLLWARVELTGDQHAVMKSEEQLRRDIEAVGDLIQKLFWEYSTMLGLPISAVKESFEALPNYAELMEKVHEHVAALTQHVERRMEEEFQELRAFLNFRSPIHSGTRPELNSSWKSSGLSDSLQLDIAQELVRALREERDGLAEKVEALEQRVQSLTENSDNFRILRASGFVYLNEGPDSHGWFPSNEEEIDDYVDKQRAKEVRHEQEGKH